MKVRIIAGVLLLLSVLQPAMGQTKDQKNRKAKLEKEIAMMISDSPQMTAISTPIDEDTPDRLSDTDEIMLLARIALMPRTCRLISAVTSSIS